MRIVQRLIVPSNRAGQNTLGTDVEKRGAERNRRALLTGSASTLARIVQIGTSLVTVPLTLRYLGNERFGLWMTIIGSPGARVALLLVVFPARARPSLKLLGKGGSRVKSL